MLCFSHDWNGDPLSKTHLMRLLSRDNRVLWVNSIGYRAPTASRRDLSRAARKIAAATMPMREVEPNIHVLSPLVIPSYGRPGVQAFNRWFLRQQIVRAMRALDFRSPLNWVFNPAASVVAGDLGEESVIYYCVDDYTAFSGVHAEALAAMERDLVAKSDLVITSSQRLQDSERFQNARTALVRHGVDWAHFRGALEPTTTVPQDLASIRGPILGYFGLIAQDWVDVDLLVHVAKAMPHASIVMIGKATMDLSALRAMPNVHILGHRPYQSLPAYCRGFDAALIPFPINDATLHSNPLKAREYLAAGLPVVSTAIPEVEALGSCRTASSYDQFVEHLKAALLSPGPDLSRSNAIRSQSWAARLAEIATHVGSIQSESPSLRTSGAQPNLVAAAA